MKKERWEMEWEGVGWGGRRDGWSDEGHARSWFAQEEMGTQLPMVLHPTCFSFHKNSSIKGEPESRTCYRIAEEILKDADPRFGHHPCSAGVRPGSGGRFLLVSIAQDGPSGRRAAARWSEGPS
jgi:hypothetical protein